MQLKYFIEILKHRGYHPHESEDRAGEPVLNIFCPKDKRNLIWLYPKELAEFGTTPQFREEFWDDYRGQELIHLVIEFIFIDPSRR